MLKKDLKEVVGVKSKDKRCIRYYFELSRNKEEWQQKSNSNMVDYLQ